MKTKKTSKRIKSFEEYKKSYFPSQAEINTKKYINTPEQIGVLLARESFKKIKGNVLEAQ